MKFSDRVKAAVNTFRKVDNNYNGRSLARDFLRRGNTKPLWNDTSQIIMRDEDLYKGYPYSAFNKRANKVAKLALENIHTNADKKVIDEARSKDEVISHPYLNLIDSSPTFSNYMFWYKIATYLDLTGTFYLYVRRNFNQNKVGEVQEFKLLNSYNVQRVFSQKELKVEGYIETRYGLQRTIDPRQIIDIRMLNPFDSEEPYGTADALRDSQYTLNKSGDFTRHALANNLNSPGIVTIGDKDLALDDEQMKIFKSRIKGDRNPGEPIFAVGDGALKWDAMQIDLDKAGLEKITDINRETLTAVTGLSLTMMGIERSGTTRDTAKVQKDLFTEDSAIPLLQLIVDALNQDYKVNYKAEYEQYKYQIIIDNPLATDIDAQIKETTLRTDQLTLVEDLVKKGYDRDEANKYAIGELELDQLTAPKEPVETEPEDKEEIVITEAHTHEEEPLTFIMNQFSQEEQGLINQNQGTLETTILNIEEKLVAAVMNRVQKKTSNAFEFKDESEILTKKEAAEAEKELALAIAAFYTIIIPLYGKNTLDKRAKEFQLFAGFNMNQTVRSYIKTASNKAAESHSSCTFTPPLCILKPVVCIICLHLMLFNYKDVGTATVRM